MTPEASPAPLHAGTFAWPRRAMTPDERQRLLRQGRLGPGKIAWAVAPLVVGAVIGVVVAQLSRWGIQLFANSDDAQLAATFAIVALLVIGGVVSFVMLLVYWQVSRPYRADARARMVEVIEAEVSRAIDLGTPAAPAYLAEVGHGQMLFLCGSWLLDPAVFGTPDVPFPQTRFTLARAPASGAVLSITGQGEPLAPEPYTLPADHTGSPIMTTRDSELIEGSIDQLLAATGATPARTARTAARTVPDKARTVPDTARTVPDTEFASQDATRED